VALAYLVGLVVVLRVELEHLSLFGIFEDSGKLVSSELLAPLLTVGEPSKKKLDDLKSSHVKRKSPRGENVNRGSSNVHSLGVSYNKLAGT
jgi:hypothetical protein